MGACVFAGAQNHYVFQFWNCRCISWRPFWLWFRPRGASYSGRFFRGRSSVVLPRPPRLCCFPFLLCSAASVGALGASCEFGYMRVLRREGDASCRWMPPTPVYVTAWVGEVSLKSNTGAEEVGQSNPTHGINDLSTPGAECSHASHVAQRSSGLSRRRIGTEGSCVQRITSGGPLSPDTGPGHHFFGESGFWDFRFLRVRTISSVVLTSKSLGVLR